MDCCSLWAYRQLEITNLARGSVESPCAARQLLHTLTDRGKDGLNPVASLRIKLSTLRVSSRCSPDPHYSYRGQEFEFCRSSTKLCDGLHAAIAANEALRMPPGGRYAVRALGKDIPPGLDWSTGEDAEMIGDILRRKLAAGTVYYESAKVFLRPCETVIASHGS